MCIPFKIIDIRSEDRYKAVIYKALSNCGTRPEEWGALDRCIVCVVISGYLLSFT